MNIINSQQHIKDLGVTMSSDCSFYEHIDLKIKQCRQLTGWILRTFKARDKSTMLTLFKSLVLPRLEYGCQLWCPATVNQIRAMESNNNNNNKVYTPLSEKCSQSRVFISQCHIIHIVQYYAYWLVWYM